jgi:GMP synthase-like glutamine amidotransferase
VIGLINAYRTAEDAPAYQLEYGPMFLKFLATLWPADKIKMYEVACGRKPKNLDECDGYIISGSPKGAYDTDPWIAELGTFIQNCSTKKKKLVGVCFGHQMIAHYLGGKAEKSKNGWGVGVRSFKISQNENWMAPKLEKAALIVSHQDQVVKLPKEARHLAVSDFCPYEMFAIGEHIFSFQGHPEFTPEFARSRLETRKELVGAEKYAQGVKTLDNKTDAPVVGGWVKSFFS